MTCREDHLVDHDVCGTGVDPDIGQGPAVLVEPALVIFEIDGLDVSKELFKELRSVAAFIGILALVLQNRFGSVDACKAVFWEDLTAGRSMKWTQSWNR